MKQLIVLAVVTLFCVIITRFVLKRVTVWEYEKGIKYRKGRFSKIVGPGQYWIYMPRTKIVAVDLRPQIINVVGQEVLSSDAVSLKVSIAGMYQVVDPQVAINSVQDYRQALHMVIQQALREIVGSKPIDELLEARGTVDKTLMELCEKRTEEFGLKLLLVNVRDIMFPGDLKKVFAQVVAARKEGLAALEKARGETAALRNLANAAKLLENNPALLQLRMIQSLGESSGNTLVLGMPADAVVPVKSDKA